jgi:hypothetical protein
MVANRTLDQIGVDFLSVFLFLGWSDEFFV